MYNRAINLVLIALLNALIFLYLPHSRYLDDANYVIRNGQFGPELNGYIKLIGDKGSAKYAFVGMGKNRGSITTFHIKTAKYLSKKAPSLGIKIK